MGRADLVGILAPAPTGHVTSGESFQISDTHSVFSPETHTGRAGRTQVSEGRECIHCAWVRQHG